jgi:hypothetical protein
MQVNPETLISNTISDRPEMVSSGAMIVEKVMIGIIFPNPH